MFGQHICYKYIFTTRKRGTFYIFVEVQWIAKLISSFWFCFVENSKYVSKENDRSCAVKWCVLNHFTAHSDGVRSYNMCLEKTARLIWDMNTTHKKRSHLLSCQKYKYTAHDFKILRANRKLYTQCM